VIFSAVTTAMTSRIGASLRTSLDKDFLQVNDKINTSLLSSQINSKLTKYQPEFPLSKRSSEIQIGTLHEQQTGF